MIFIDTSGIDVLDPIRSSAELMKNLPWTGGFVLNFVKMDFTGVRINSALGDNLFTNLVNERVRLVPVDVLTVTCRCSLTKDIFTFRTLKNNLARRLPNDLTPSIDILR